MHQIERVSKLTFMAPEYLPLAFHRLYTRKKEKRRRKNRTDHHKFDHAYGLPGIFIFMLTANRKLRAS